MFDKTELVKLNVSGMHCGHCKARVEEALKNVKGVKKVEVDLEHASAEVAYIPGKTGADELIAAVTATGFGAELA